MLNHVYGRRQYLLTLLDASAYHLPSECTAFAKTGNQYAISVPNLTVFAISLHVRL